MRHVLDLEERGTRQEKPSFLSLVDYLADASSETISNMRLSLHPIGTDGFTDSLPDKLREDPIATGHIRTIVNDYLTKMKAERVLDLPRDSWGARKKDVIKENASQFSHLINAWMTRHYGYIKEVDEEIGRFEVEVRNFAEVAAARRSTSLAARLDIPDVEFNFNGDLRRACDRYRRDIYRSKGLHEDPVELYAIAFKETVKIRGWDQLEDQELAKVLIEEEVPIELFEEYTGRNVKVPVPKKARTPRIEGGAGARDDGAEQTTELDFSNPNLIITQVPELGYISGYGTVLATLREVCNNDPNSVQPLFDGQPRPLTPRESLLARIEDYNTLTNPDGSERTIQDRLRLFNKGFWTSAGILWKYPGDKSVPIERRQALVPVRAKVSTICPELLRLTPDFNQVYVEVPDFDSFEGEEIDLSQGIWDARLTQAQVPEHIGWRKLVGDDEEGGRILRNYAGIVFSEVQRLYQESTAMGFWKRRGIETNEVRAPWVDIIYNRSNADGNYDLIDNGASVRVSQAPQR